MKKIMIILLVTFSVGMYAQKEKSRQTFTKDFSPEQQAILKTKKMALDFELNETQQNQMLELNKQWMAEREKNMAARKDLNPEEMSATDRFNMMNSKLDAQLSHQKQMKKVLNSEQYEMWKRSVKMKEGQRSYRKQGPSQGKYHQGKK